LKQNPIGYIKFKLFNPLLASYDERKDNSKLI